MDDWVVVTGLGDAIYHLECSVYPPGTPQNADFELAVVTPHIFYLAKKTDELHRFCPTPDFDELMAIIFHDPVESTGDEGRSGWLSEVIMYDTAHKAVAIDRFVSQLTQQPDGTHKTEDQGANDA